MNKVILMGRLTKDPEIRYSQSAEPVCVARYTLAVNRRFKRDGEPDADFINCVAFGRAGEFAEKYLAKGKQMLISGRLTVRSWDDQNGQKHWTTEVVVEDHEFAESKSAEGRGNAPSNSGPYATPQNMAPPSVPDGFSAITETIDDEDLPF